MNTNNFEPVAIIVACVLSNMIGFMVGTVVISLADTGVNLQYRQGLQVIEQCEKELPRNQHCELVISAEPRGGEL